LKRKSWKYLTFEIARLRTAWDRHPEIRSKIEKRYKEVATETLSRYDKWFWTNHPLDKCLKKGVGSFVKPNKPATRIFEAKELFDDKDFSLPAYVDIKIDGMRIQIHKSNTVELFSEDEGFKKSNKFKKAVTDINEALPKGTVVDSEGVLVVNDQVLHRTSFIGYANGKEYLEEKDEQSQFWVFDVLYWEGKDLRDLPYKERLDYLKKIKTTKHLKPTVIGKRGFICKTEKELLAAIKKVRAMKGSEGAMIKTLEGKYIKAAKDIAHNKTWFKLKNLKEIDCIVVDIEQPKHKKGPLEGKPIVGVYNYHIAAGPYSKECASVVKEKKPKKVIELKGKTWAYFGKTFNTSIKVKVGDIIRVFTPEVNRYKIEGTDCYTFGVFEPKVLEHVRERNRPDSMNVLMRLSGLTLPREVEKADWCSEQGGKWITVEGKHICIGEDRDLGEGLTERTLISRDHKTKLIFDVGRRETVDEVSSLYNHLPEKKKKRVDYIRISREPYTLDEFYRSKGKEVPSEYKKYGMPFVGGYYDKRTKEMGFFKGSTKETIYHEFGHVVAPQDYETANRWTETVWKEEKVSKYANVNWDEGFAEAFVWYKKDPAGVKLRNPKTYKFMEEYLSGKD